MMHWIRFAAVLAAPLVLFGCVITPGKFVSTLDIDADRSFAFTYVGEVYAVDMANAMSEGMTGGLTGEPSVEPEAEPDGASFLPIAQQEDADTTAEKKAQVEAKNRAIAEALAKEKGYRKVAYLGEGKFMIDYAIQGTLTHNFIYPFNSDAEVMFPFIAIELRGADTVRMTAPAFANRSNTGPPGMDDPSAKLDGTFTLSTNAQIVSQNNEDGAKSEGGRQIIAWRATPLSKTAPLAVLKLAK